MLVVKCPWLTCWQLQTFLFAVVLLQLGLSMLFAAYLLDITAVMLKIVESHRCTVYDVWLLWMCQIHTVCSKKSDAKIEIRITATNPVRIKYPLSIFNYHLSVANIANFNKIHCTVFEQQLFKQVAQLSQRDRAAGWVSNGQKWKTGTERQYLRTM